jgi:hypothetical protein
MAGLKTHVDQIKSGCDDAAEMVEKLRTARDPDRARSLAHEAARAMGDAVHSIGIIDREDAWPEVDALQAKTTLEQRGPDIC